GLNSPFALIWLALYLLARRNQTVAANAAIVALPNVAAISLAALVSCETLMDFVNGFLLSSPTVMLGSGLGWALILFAGIFLTLSVWNDRALLRITHLLLWAFSVAASIVFWQISRMPNTLIVSVSVVSWLFAVWGIAFHRRSEFKTLATSLGIPRLGRLRNEAIIATSALSVVIGFAALSTGFMSILTVDGRLLRYVAAFSPLGLAIGMAAVSNGAKRRWLQLSSLACVMAAGILVSMADLSTDELSSGLSVAVRILVVLALFTFFYGGVVPRLTRHTDRWLTSFKT
ncbi:unnamed protein product, partial [marine sediment metagenome]